MISVTPQTKILVAVEPTDFRKGIDGLCRLCRTMHVDDPFSGAVFVFRNRRGTSIKLLAYDGQGFWLCMKRLSQGKFPYWPSKCRDNEALKPLLAHQLQVLLVGGNPYFARGAPQWRPITPTNTTPPNNDHPTI